MNEKILPEPLPEDMEALLQLARTPQFGAEEGRSADLATWLMCEAFEHRFSPQHSEALHLAAMIVSRARP